MTSSHFREGILANLGRGKLSFRRTTPAQVLVVGFAVVILIGALLLSLPVASNTGQPTGFVNALFTATSAVCVTGLVVEETGTYWSLFGQLVILALVQIGGLGLMTLSTMLALILGRKVGLKERLVIQESLGQLSLEGMVRLILAVLAVTFAFEGLGFVILGSFFAGRYGLWRGLYFGLFHAVSAFCNAGLDLFGNFQSLQGFQGEPLVLLTIGSLIIFGGLGFAVIVDLLHFRKTRHLVLHSRLVLLVTVALLVIGTCGFFALEYKNPHSLGALPLGEKVLNAFFAAVSPRTAGFTSLNLAQLTRGGMLWIIALMYIGASPGSTGGGIKTTTFALIIATLWGVIRGREGLVLYGRKIPAVNIIKAFSVALALALLILIVTFLLTLSEDAGFLPLLFEVTSAAGTVGLSTGITPGLTSFAKFLLILTMFAGRVGPLTIATALGGRGGELPVQFPEERVTVG